MFNGDFIFGSGTAAYQVEGAHNSDGKSESIWDRFAHTKGKIAHNENGDIACDHYNRFKEDVKLMKDMGLDAYRFSISWCRIIPDGVGIVNYKGVEFYNNLIDLLIENGITPFITLYHWDLPQVLEDKGGWLNPDIADWFEAYAKTCAELFGDRVKNFFTFNEPQIFSEHGYIRGGHAPGHKFGRDEYLKICHNILLANGMAVKAIKSVHSDIKVGMAVSMPSEIPVSKEAEKYADEFFGAVNSIEDIPNSRALQLWLDPVYFGRYPKIIEDYAREYLPEILNGMDVIKVKLDYIGGNNYQGSYFDVYPDGTRKWVPRKPGAATNHLGWSITPEALYWCSREICTRYGCDFFITENGLAMSEMVCLDGKVHDPQRIDYMHRYLNGLEKAYDEGYPIKGYFAWSFMDNFEWASGYEERFGLIYVDFETLERIPKDSAYWYKEYIRSRKETDAVRLPQKAQ